MPDVNDPDYLREGQYRDAANLNARITLHQRFGTNPVPWQRWVFEQFRLPSAGRILELGCGPAGLWQANLDRVPRGWEITLSDFSPGMLVEARQALGAYESRFRYAELDARAIPFADGALDGVIANHMLYHVPDRPRALAEIARVLKPGGVLYAATNGARHLHEIGALIARADPALGEQWAAWHGAFNDTFTLENGAAQLRPYFAMVAMRRYKNDLRVTEAEPLAAYIASTQTGQALGGRRAVLEDVVRAALAEQGAITITSDTGMFQAIKAF